MIRAFKAIAPIALWLFGVWLGICGLVVFSWGWPDVVGVPMVVLAMAVIASAFVADR